MFAPSTYKYDANMGKKPDEQLTLKWAHGFTAHGTNRTLAYLPDGKIAYATAGLPVVFDPVEHTQTYFREHKEDVVSLAVSPCGKYIATSEMAGKDLNETSKVKIN